MSNEPGRRSFLKRTLTAAATAATGGTPVANPSVSSTLGLSGEQIFFRTPPLVSLAAGLASLRAYTGDRSVFTYSDLTHLLDAIAGNPRHVFYIPDSFSGKTVGDLFGMKQLLSMYSNDFYPEGCRDFERHRLLAIDPIALNADPRAGEIITKHASENPIPAIESFNAFCEANGITHQDSLQKLLAKLNETRLESLRASLLRTAQNHPEKIADELLSYAHFNKKGAPPLKVAEELLDQLGIRYTEGDDDSTMNKLREQILATAEDYLRKPPKSHIEIEEIPDNMKAYIFRHNDNLWNLKKQVFDHLKKRGIPEEELTAENIRVNLDTVYVKRGNPIQSCIEDLILSMRPSSPEGWEPNLAAPIVQQQNQQVS